MAGQMKCQRSNLGKLHARQDPAHCIISLAQIQELSKLILFLVMCSEMIPSNVWGSQVWCWGFKPNSSIHKANTIYLASPPPIFFKLFHKGEGEANPGHKEFYPKRYFQVNKFSWWAYPEHALRQKRGAKKKKKKVPWALTILAKEWMVSH